MTPWFWNWSPMWNWAPQIHFPLSGSVQQDIRPDFFDAIPLPAGIGPVERKVFQASSYGSQLSAILKVLVPLAERATPASEEERKAVAELRAMADCIHEVKTQAKAELAEDAAALLVRLAASDPALRERLLRLLGPAAADQT